MIKPQLIVDAKNVGIICTAHAEGSTHDLKLYENSIGSAVSDDIKMQGDKGYQGILKMSLICGFINF